MSRSVPLRLALVACIWLPVAWGAELYVRRALPFWDVMDADQRRCHLEAWLSGQRAMFGDGRCESLE